jgi:hypothetical protein
MTDQRLEEYESQAVFGPPVFSVTNNISIAAKRVIFARVAWTD